MARTVLVQENPPGCSSTGACRDAQGRAGSFVARRTRAPAAALAAAGKFVAGWTHAADRFAQAIGDELLRSVDGRTG